MKTGDSMMKHRLFPVICMLALVAVGAPGALFASTADDASPAPKVSFQSDLMPILKRRCAACHITGDEPGKMALVPGKAYDFIVDVDAVDVAMKRIAPGDPDNSYLLHKLLGTHLDVGGNGVRMPFHQGPLPKKDLDNFRLWIEQGANNN